MAGFTDDAGLTPKMRAFAKNVAAGMSLTDAYRASYDAENMKPATIRNKASGLFLRDEIRAMIEAEKAGQERLVQAQTVGDREMLLTHLRSWATGEKDATQVQLRAAELLGKACGLYRDVVEDHRERPAQVVAAELESRLAGLMDRLNGSHDDEGSGGQGSSDEGVEGEGEGEPGAVEPGEGEAFH